MSGVMYRGNAYPTARSYALPICAGVSLPSCAMASMDCRDGTGNFERFAGGVDTIVVKLVEFVDDGVEEVFV